MKARAAVRVLLPKTVQQLRQPLLSLGIAWGGSGGQRERGSEARGQDPGGSLVGKRCLGSTYMLGESHPYRVSSDLHRCVCAYPVCACACACVHMINVSF